LRLSGHPTARISNFFLCNKEEKIKGIRICVCKEKGGGGGGGAHLRPYLAHPPYFYLFPLQMNSTLLPQLRKKRIIPDRKYF
jgi:hypothetical protein